MGRHQQGLSPAIGHLWPHHRSMARAMIAGGLTPGQLAVSYGFSEGQISRIIQSPLFLAELERLEGQAEAISVDLKIDIRNMATRAIEVLDENLNQIGVDPKLRTATAMDILDRAGYRKSDRPIHFDGDVTLNQVNIENMSDKELQREVMGFLDKD